MWRSHASRMAIQSSRPASSGLRPRCPIPQPRYGYGRRAVPPAHRRLCVVAWVMIRQKAVLEPRYVPSQLWRIDAITGQALHELRRSHAQLSNC